MMGELAPTMHDFFVFFLAGIVTVLVSYVWVRAVLAIYSNVRRKLKEEKKSWPET